MGAGIAEVFARGGYDVLGVENADAALDGGRGNVVKSTDRAVAKGKLDAAEQAALLARITFSTDIAEVSTCRLIVEAVSEDMALKSTIFSALDEHAPDNAVLATNTSSLSITAIGALTSRPERVLGVHFFNPAPVQTLVEVIHTVNTDDTAAAEIHQVLRSLGKSPISCGDRAGFIVNALLIGYLNRAVKLMGEGFASRGEIDAAMVDSAGYPMGPLTLLDLIGLDVAHAVLVRMYDETKDRLQAPDPLLSQLVAAGWLGRKSGRGFYSYDRNRVTSAAGPVGKPSRNRADELPATLIVPYLNDACRMVEINYATATDIDTGMSQGCRMPKPFDMLAEIGPAAVLEAQQRLHAESGEPGHRPALLLAELAQAAEPAQAIAQLRG